MRVRTVASEAALGLRRNLVMSIAAVLTIAISLAFVGTAFLVGKEVSRIRERFYTDIDISIFLAEEVTPAQRDEVAATVNRLTVVRSVTYESKAEAYRRFKLQFQDQPDLIANVTEAALPESYRVKLKDPRQYDVIATAVKDLPGVSQVVDYRKFLKPLFATLDGLRNASYYLAALQLVAAILLISNTVRVTAFSRRRETGVMRLVGATRLYIQLPFLVEGLAAGLIGAALGIGVLFAGKALLLDRSLKVLFSSSTVPKITYMDMAQTAPYLVLLGIVISGLASLVTLQRYIRV